MPVCRALRRMEDSENSYQPMMYGGGLLERVWIPEDRRVFIKRMILSDMEEFEEFLLEEGSALGAFERELFLEEPRCAIW